MFLVGLYFYNVYYRNIKLKRDREYKNDWLKFFVRILRGVKKFFFFGLFKIYSKFWIRWGVEYLSVKLRG